MFLIFSFNFGLEFLHLLLTLFFHLQQFPLRLFLIFVEASYGLIVLSPNRLHLLLIFFNFHLLSAYFLLVLIDNFGILLRELNLFIEFLLEGFDLCLQTFFFLGFIWFSVDDLAEISISFLKEHFMNVGLIFIRVTYTVAVTLLHLLRIDFLYYVEAYARGVFGREGLDELILVLLIFLISIFISLECLWEIRHSRMSYDVFQVLGGSQCGTHLSNKL